MDKKTCQDCKYAYIEDIWYSYMCKKNHLISIDFDDGLPNEICEEFEEDH